MHSLTLTHTSFYMPTLFSCLCSKHTIPCEEGKKGHGRSSSMENSHGALSPGQSQYQFPDQNYRKPTQETLSHNRTAMLPPKKQKVTKSLLHEILHPLYTLENSQSVFIFPTQEPCNQGFCSNPTKNKTKNSPTTKNTKMLADA